MRPFPLMLFAAGFGTRMGALTANRPKPLVTVAGRPLIDHALDQAAAIGPRKTVVNVHYLGHQIERYLHGRNITIAWERDQILDTGGGLKSALPQLGQGPVILLNTDAVWSGENPLKQLIDAWDEDRMDALLLLLPAKAALGHKGPGDFLLADDGRIRRANGAVSPVYLGAQILRQEPVLRVKDNVFGLNRVWDDVIARERAFGLIHHGGWCDVGSPEGIKLAESMLANV